MKPLSEIVSLTIDYGTFICVAEAMGEKVKKSYIYTPYEDEYRDLQKCCIGDGLSKCERIDEFMDPDFLKTVDLAIFPDIGYGGLQRYFRSIGIPVWGSFGASDLELYRTRFMKVLNELGLPAIHSERIVGLTALSEHLKSVEDKFVKVNRYRANMETWHHQDWIHSQRKMEELALTFGPLKERVIFIMQDPIPDAREIGYDGWYACGQFPQESYQGYEKKNQLYLGSRLNSEDLPDSVKAVNEAFSPVLAEYGYCNFWATEIRDTDDGFYFIDPTSRMAGQTMEHQFETCSNLPEVMWSSANGEILPPKFSAQFSAEATLHYNAGSPDQWKILVIPDEVRKWFKLYHCCYADGAYHFPPGKNDEVGVVISNGDTIEETIDNLKDNFALIDGEPVEITIEGFANLLTEVKKAEKEGIEFTDQEIPGPEIAIQP